MRDNLFQALNSFIKATNGSVTLIMYTYLSESIFDERIVSTPGLEDLWSSSDCPIERVIFLPSSRLGIFDDSELTIDLGILPEGTKELLWVHPLMLDYNEVLARLKTKQYGRLLNHENVHFTTGLPRVQN